jgi:DNA (cytosine-5)-methyltransferase 1
MHVCPGHTPTVQARIAATPHDGGSWADVAARRPDLLVPSMKGKRPGSFPDVYGRLRWDRPAITVTRECGHPGNGRYLHPEQDRMLSVREMALLQGFPPGYTFLGPLSARYNQIGDAVPPLVSRRVAGHVAGLLHAQDTAGERGVPVAQAA